GSLDGLLVGQRIRANRAKNRIASIVGHGQRAAAAQRDAWRANDQLRGIRGRVQVKAARVRDTRACDCKNSSVGNIQGVVGVYGQIVDGRIYVERDHGMLRVGIVDEDVEGVTAAVVGNHSRRPVGGLVPVTGRG